MEKGHRWPYRDQEAHRSDLLEELPQTVFLKGHTNPAILLQLPFFHVSKAMFVRWIFYMENVTAYQEMD